MTSCVARRPRKFTSLFTALARAGHVTTAVRGCVRIDAQPASGESEPALKLASRLGSPQFTRIFVSLAWVLAIAAPIGISRATMAVLPLNADQGLYVTIGQIIKAGGVVGRDSWDNKPPGTYYLYAGLLSLAPDYSERCVVRGGPLPAAGYELPCAQELLSTFDSVYALAVAGLLWLIGRRLFGGPAGVIAAWLCATFASMIQIVHGGGIPDFHALLPITLAYLAAILYEEARCARFLVLSGALAGLTVLFKQTGLVVLAHFDGHLKTGDTCPDGVRLNGQALEAQVHERVQS